jgi:pimeloyl-ACP methyl ester carboxylesterase
MSESGPGSAFIQAGGVRLHYNDIGKGHPVVCLHGGGPGASGWSNFSQNVPALSAKFRLLLVDMPQFGRSEKVVFKEGRLTYVARVLKDLSSSSSSAGRISSATRWARRPRSSSRSTIRTGSTGSSRWATARSRRRSSRRGRPKA